MVKDKWTQLSELKIDLDHAQYYTADADATQLSNWVASAVWTEFATSSRRLPTDSIDNLETDWPNKLQSGLATVLRILIDVDKFYNNDVIMSSLVTNSTGNCKLGYDCRRVRSHRRRDSTRQLSRVGVSGVYWASDDIRLFLALCKSTWPIVSFIHSRCYLRSTK